MTMTPQRELELKKLACQVRMGVLTSTHGAKAGHPGGSLSAADVLTYLYWQEGWRTDNRSHPA